MSSEEIRKRFFEFFKERGHAVVPSSSLIPTDPSVLLTTAGMQQFKRYFTGELNPKKDFGSQRTASIQKCFRTSDVDEVGDETHLTFFEMLGNFSFGPVGKDDPKDFGQNGYFKRSAIHWGYEFLTQTLGISPERIAVSIFKGDKEVPRDNESFRIWHEEIGLSKNKIGENGRADNFWGPTGAEGPCGPTAEIYVDGIEVWNLVFNEYYQKADKTLEKLKNPGVDTGMGLERLAMVVQGVPTIFETDLFQPLMEMIPSENIRVKRIITDHVRGVVHLMADGIEPSNKDRGYILRRLLRRAAFHAIDIAGEQARIPLGSITPKSWNERASLKEIAALAVDLSYFKIDAKKDLVFAAIDKEINFFELLKSRRELRDLIREYLKSRKNNISGEDAFKLFSTFGIPIDYIKDEAAKSGLSVDLVGFEDQFKKHQEISRVGAVKKFGGHGLILNTGELKAGDEGELKKVTRLHTATHLLHQSLREVLGDSVRQMGSDITPERTRFDFSFNRKMTPEELKRVEEIANEKVKEDLPVQFQEMAKDEAEKTGALHFFKEKYPEKVKVYYIGRDLKSAWSKEFCGGPHVSHTSEIGHIKILKEEAVGAGARRIRATVE